MNTQLGIAAVVLLALTSGFFIGQATGGGGSAGRIAEIEEQIAELKDQLDAPGRARAPRAPARADAVRAVDVEGAPSRGAEKASVTVVEFTDYQCPYCRRVQPTVQRLLDEHPDQVRHVIKHNPLTIHPQAPGAAKAAIAAGRQGKFWEMHSRIFENPRLISEEDLRARAREMGLDMDQFDEDLASEETAEIIASDQAEARRLGATGTPAFFINGRLLSGAQPYDAFKARVDQELAESEVAG
jgi:protein-disulfide isomerase